MAPQHDMEGATSNSPFLFLPAELRNTIYRLALVKYTWLHLDRRPWDSHQPPLLRTCRQTRGEALKFFYTLNQFTLELRDWDGSVMHRLFMVCQQNEITGMVLKERLSGGPNWLNLKTWVQQYHAGENMKTGPALPQHSNEDAVVFWIFQMVILCKDMPWDRVEKLIDTHRVALVRFDSKWA